MDKDRSPVFPVDWDPRYERREYSLYDLCTRRKHARLLTQSHLREGTETQETIQAKGIYDDALCLGSGAPLYSDRVLPIWPSGLVELTEWPGNFERPGLRLDGAKLVSIGPGHAQRQLVQV
jgi:hypothetical protein